MQLKRFSVKGFKNFRQEVVLENMGDICVIHGENNVGKSNVLEAMRLLFVLFPIPNSNAIDNLLKQNSFNRREIFTFGLNNPIDISVTLDCEKNTDVTLDISIPIQNDDGSEFRHNFNNNFQSGIQTSCLTNFLEKRFALIGVDRQINDTETEKERCIVPQSLLLQLYDIKDSPEPAVFEKW